MDGVGVPSEPLLRLEEHYVVLAGQVVGRHDSRNPGSDDGDALSAHGMLLRDMR
jgi:hypothetical protein